MTLRNEFRQAIEQYLAGEITLWDVYGFLGSVVDVALKSPDAEVQRLNGILWLAVAEWTSSEIEEPIVQDRLRQALQVPAVDEPT